MYTIGDFLIQLKNGYQASKKQIVYPHSKVVEGIAKILEKEGLIAKSKILSEKSKGARKYVELELKYTGRTPALSLVKIISKPSVHRYINSKNLSTKIARRGITILTTSQGIMTGAEAKSKQIGGELICQIF